MPITPSMPSRRIGGFLLLSILLLGVQAQALAGGPPYSAFVAEVESDRVLYSHDPDELRHPASLTKMMTLYLLFEALSRGQITLQDPMVASVHAVSKPPSRLGLRPGDTITVEEGILGLVTQSANDAATVIAETLGGSEAMFADMMTQKARQLGMNSTVFRNAQGLPDPDQWTTARDMYKLGKALIKNFPQFYPYFATESFWFRDRSFKNHNHLLGKCEGVDGIKTGFINSSGFNLVASSKRNGVRLVGVVFGGPTHHRRDAHMQEILEDGFAQLDGHEPSVHMVSFGTPTPEAQPAIIPENQLVPVARRVRVSYKPSPVQRHPVAVVAPRKHEAPAVSSRHAHAPAPLKVATREVEVTHSSKAAKPSASVSHAPPKQTSAHAAAPKVEKKNGKPKSGH